MSDPGTLDTERRAGLHVAKLRALVRDGFDVVDGETAGFTGGATLVSGDRGWYLAEVDPQQSLGWAMAWARQQGLASLDLLAADAAGHLARRATEFDAEVGVWEVDDASVARATASDHPVPPPVHDGVDHLLDLLRGAELDVVEEHGEVWGEILGLEVARVVRRSDGGLALEVGVGRNDRQAFGMLHGEVPAPHALAAVVDSVRRHRCAGAPAHPLNRLAAERWLRRLLIDAPQHVHASQLQIVQPILPRPNIKDQSPAAAVGRDEYGDPIVVVCTVGVDLDAVATLADVGLRHAPAAGRQPSLVLALPERDALPATRALVDDLNSPARVQTVDGEWRSYA